MKNLKINECLFHGIRGNSKQTPIEVLSDILESKYVLTYEDLRKKGICHEREAFTNQGMNAISICFHPENNQLYESFKNICITINNGKRAFNQFVNTDKPSIIFSKEILSNLPFRTFGGYKRMIDEIQMLSSIPLEYMIAIGYGNSENNEESINKIKELLEKHNYNVPIINPVDGTNYETNKKLVLK